MTSKWKDDAEGNVDDDVDVVDAVDDQLPVNPRKVLGPADSDRGCSSCRNCGERKRSCRRKNGPMTVRQKIGRNCARRYFRRIPDCRRMGRSLPGEKGKRMASDEKELLHNLCFCDSETVRNKNRFWSLLKEKEGHNVVKFLIFVDLCSLVVYQLIVSSEFRICPQKIGKKRVQI